MDKITPLLTDPTWWFTAVFAAIVASLFGSYLRDGFSWVFAKSSTVVKNRRSLRIARENEEVEFLSQHSLLLIAELVRALVLFGVLCLLVGVVLYSNLLLVVTKIPNSGFEGGVLSGIWLLNLLLAGICAAIVGYFTTTHMRAAARAVSKFRRQLRDQP